MRGEGSIAGAPVGARIRARRKELGLSLDELAGAD